MLFSELCGKHILDINTGMILGSVEEADLLVDEFTGKIEALLIPNPNLRRSRGFQSDEMQIRWRDIKTVGPEMIVVDFNKDIIPL